MSKTRSLKVVADWLQSQGVKIIAKRGVRACAAEQIPLGVLPKLQAMTDGEIQLLEASDGRYQVVRLVASKAAPVDEATATPRIQQFLFNQHARNVLAAEMKRIREVAKIEYVGEFLGSTAEAITKVNPEAKQIPGRSSIRGRAKPDPNQKTPPTISRKNNPPKRGLYANDQERLEGRF